jgi:SagB-type dehydrogenase family enzyme
VLLERRTWRAFGNAPLSLEITSTLLDLSFGVQATARTMFGEDVMFKTSPSPGATHSLQAYVLALNVEDLARGLYWYDVASHGLERLKGRIPARAASRFLGRQWWFDNAAVIVFLTGVAARIQHRYSHARTYRSWLLEAGHVCQTFCLTATWLQLAPFCTQALADSKIEQALGLNGTTESVLYAMGAGARPPGRSAAPWPSEHIPGRPFVPKRPASRDKRPAGSRK